MEANQSLLTAKQVAERLSVSLGLVYKLTSAGKLACYRIGGVLRFTEGHVCEFLERSQERQPTIQRRSFPHLDL